MLIKEDMDIKDKLKILADSAKYDAACTSSGSDRRGSATGIGSTVSSGICHSFAADGRCISLLKILFTNECIYDCRYCINRRSNDVLRTSFTPEEVCTLTMEFYRRNYIEGLFLSSGIVVSPTHTMQLLLKTVKLLRCVYHFNGYIHVKGIPGADPSVIEETGWYVDRMSVNLELATADALRRIAPNKSRRSILTPMRQIQLGIRRNELLLADYHSMTSARPAYIDSGNAEHLSSFDHNIQSVSADNAVSPLNIFDSRSGPKAYVPAGQSTQMVIGASDESDYQIISVSEALYQKFEMKRIFYSAFINVNHDSSLPDLPGPPLLREHRLYQADFLLRFYGFRADELLSEKNPNFNEQIDPKCNWAVHHLELFPVEINRADYYTLLRVPGIGTKSARRIMAARRYAKLDFSDLKKIGVVLKRAVYFITCKGKMMYHTRMEEGYITRNLMYQERPMQMLLSDGTVQTYEQLSLFDDRGKIVV